MGAEGFTACREAPPRLTHTLTRVSHSVLEDDGGTQGVWVKEYIRCYDDGTIELAVHRVDDALVGFCETYDDPRLAEVMLGYAARLGALASRVTSALLGFAVLL
jgi:hypothetical protein